MNSCTIIYLLFVTASGIIGMVIILTAFERFVALLQAYIFIILTGAYLLLKVQFKAHWKELK